MAKKEDTMSTEIAIDGEREYKAACKEIKDSLNLIGSEMKVVTAEFGTNAKSVEGLTAKQDVLNKRLSEQEKQVKAAADALEKFKAAGEAGAGGAQKMETKLNEAKAAMIKTQKELDETGKQLDDAGKDATEFSEDVKKAGTETEAAGGKFSKLGGVLGKVGKAFGTGMVAIGAAAAGVASALVASTVAGSNYADDLLTQSTYTRQSAEDLQKYAYAARFVDVDMNTLTKSMTKNIKSMDSARGGTGAMADAYKKLGVSVTNSDGSLKDSNDVYWQTIDALKGVTNETERDALAMQILGKSGTELNSVIEAGSEKFKSYGAEAEKMGAVMSEDQLNKLGAFNDKIQVLSAGMDGLKNASSLIALPFLDVMAGEGIGILGDFTSGINAANGDMGKMADVVGGTIASIVNVIAEQLPAFIDMGVNMLQSLVSGIVDNLPAITAAAVEVVMSLCNGLIEMLPLLLEGAIQIIAGLAQGLSAALPTLIPKIVEMLMLMVQTLVDNIPLLIDCALQLVMGLAQGILAALPVLVAAIPSIILGLVDALIAAIPQIIQAGIDLITALVTALPEIITAIVAAIPEIINGVITAVIGAIPQLIQAGIDLFIALVQALPQIIVAIVAAIPQIITSVITAIIGAIPLLIQAGIDLFISLIKNLPTIIIEIVKAVPQIIDGIVSAFGSLMGSIVEIGGNILKGIWDGICAAGAWLTEKVTGFFGGIVDGVKNFLGIHSPSTVFADVGGNMAAGVGVGFGGEMDGVSSDMQSAIGGAGEVTAQEAVNAINTGIISNIAQLDQAVTAVVERILTGLTAQNPRMNNQGLDFDKNIASGMVSGVSEITAKVPQVVQSIITAFVAQFPKFQNVGLDFDKNIASGMVSGVSEITAKVPQIVNPILEAFRSVTGQFTAIGENIMRGLWTGFENMAGWLEDKVRAMMRDIVRAVEDEMDIRSPSKVFAGIGGYMAQGLGVGFADEMRTVEKSIRKATATTAPKPPRATGKLPRGEGKGGVNVTQHIYANETSYAAQQREAAKQFKLIAREI